MVCGIMNWRRIWFTCHTWRREGSRGGIIVEGSNIVELTFHLIYSINLQVMCHMNNMRWCHNNTTPGLNSELELMTCVWNIFTFLSSTEQWKVVPWATFRNNVITAQPRLIIKMEQWKQNTDSPFLLLYFSNKQLIQRTVGLDSSAPWNKQVH